MTGSLHVVYLHVRLNICLFLVTLSVSHYHPFLRIEVRLTRLESFEADPTVRVLPIPGCVVP